MRKPNFGPFQGLEYHLACADAANLPEDYQLTLIQQWMMWCQEQNTIREFKIRAGSQLDPEMMKPVPCFIVEYTLDQTMKTGSVVVETLHLTKEASVCMYVHDT